MATYDERAGAATQSEDVPGPSNVFLAPADPGNFDRTVVSPVDLTDHPDRPGALADRDSARFWGVRDGTRNRQQFERMAAGDVVLFYQEAEYVGVGRVGATFEDDGWASETFWRDAPAERVYVLDRFDAVSVPRSAVNRIFGYEPDYYPQGLLGVADGRLPDPVAAVPVAVRRYDERRG